MKKVINGKTYNTKTAQMVGAYDNNLPLGDLNYVYEELYRKRTGEFFIYGESGARGKYSTYYGNNSWGGGCKINPLSVEEAKVWIEENLDYDAYVKMFGEPEE